MNTSCNNQDNQDKLIAEVRIRQIIRQPCQ